MVGNGTHTPKRRPLDFRFKVTSGSHFRFVLQARRRFAATLTERGVCLQRDTRVCDLRDVNIVCGTEYQRKYVTSASHFR